MEPITLIAAGLLCITIGAKLAPKPTIKSDSYSLSQIREVVSAMDQDSVVTGIERLIPVSVNGDEPATLYDLNSDEGYLVLGENYKIFDYQQKVEVVDELQDNELEYNPINKGFTKHGGEFVSVTGNPQKQETKNNQSVEYKEPFVDYGCGQIEQDNLESYVQNKFSGGTLDDEFSLPVRRNKQGELSVYEKIWVEDGKVHTVSEGNCWLCASYTAFDYLANQSAHSLTSFSNFPRRANQTKYYPRSQEPDTYNWVKANASGYHPCEDPSGTYKVKSFDYLYIALRQKGATLKESSPITGLSKQIS